MNANTCTHCCQCVSTDLFLTHKYRSMPQHPSLTSIENNNVNVSYPLFVLFDCLPWWATQKRQKDKYHTCYKWEPHNWLPLTHSHTQTQLVSMPMTCIGQGPGYCLGPVFEAKKTVTKWWFMPDSPGVSAAGTTALEMTVSACQVTSRCSH